MTSKRNAGKENKWILHPYATAEKSTQGVMQVFTAI